jgi:hypothetical protein
MERLDSRNTQNGMQSKKRMLDSCLQRTLCHGEKLTNEV